MFNLNIDSQNLKIPAVIVLSQYGAEAADIFWLSENASQIAVNSYSCKP